MIATNRQSKGWRPSSARLVVAVANRRQQLRLELATERRADALQHQDTPPLRLRDATGNVPGLPKSSSSSRRSSIPRAFSRTNGPVRSATVRVDLPGDRFLYPVPFSPRIRTAIILHRDLTDRLEDGLHGGAVAHKPTGSSLDRDRLGQEPRVVWLREVGASSSCESGERVDEAKARGRSAPAASAGSSGFGQIVERGEPSSLR